MKLKTDWWLVNSIVNILVGLSSITYNLIVVPNKEIIVGELYIGGISILIGLALLQRSKIVFWIVLINSSVSFFSQLIKFSKSPVNYLPIVVTGIVFAFSIMLWQQIKNELKMKGKK